MGLRDDLGPFLERLTSRLDAQGIRVSPDQMIDANDLRLAQFWADGKPLDIEFVKFALAPIFCTSAQEQQNFYRIFDELLPAQADDVQIAPQARRSRKASPQQPPALRSYSNRLRWAPWIAVVGVLSIGVVWAVLRLLPGGDTPPTPGPTPSTDAAVTVSQRSESAQTTPQTVEFEIPPRPPADVTLIRTGQVRVLKALQIAFSGVPLLVGLAWLARRLLARRVFLGKRRTTGHPALRPLPIRSARAAIFDHYNVTAAVTGLRMPQREPTRRLDVARSVDATVRNGGYPQLRFATRSRRPGYVILIERQSPVDLFARAAENLADRLYRGGLEVWPFVFTGRPYRLSPLARLSVHGTYEQVKQRYHGDTLIVIGEPGRILHGTAARATPWAADIKGWAAGTLLTSNPCDQWGPEERGFHAQKLAVATFGSAGLDAVSPWLSHDEPASGNDIPPFVWRAPEGALYPPLLNQYARRWLRDDPPDQQDAMIGQLRDYLGGDGVFLLAAMVSYPEFNWDIALYLNEQLFHGTPDEHHAELRMIRIAELPWCRQGRMPDWLHARLFRLLSSDQLKRIQRCFDSLLDSELGGERVEAASISVAGAPGRDRGRLEFLKTFFSTAPPGPHRDAVFQWLMLSPPDKLVTQEIPRERAEQRGGLLWEKLVADAGVGLVRIAAATAVVVFLLMIGRTVAESWLVGRNTDANGQFAVQLFYRPESDAGVYDAFSDSTEALARRLTWALEARGFAVDMAPMTEQPATQAQRAAIDTDESFIREVEANMPRVLLAQEDTSIRPPTPRRQDKVVEQAPSNRAADKAPDAGAYRRNENADPSGSGAAQSQPTVSIRAPADLRIESNAIAFDNGFGMSWLRQQGVSRDNALTRSTSTPNAVFVDAVQAQLAYLTFDVPVTRYDYQDQQISNELLDLLPAGTAAEPAPSEIRVWLRQPSRAFQDRLQKGGVGPVMTVVPAGSFTMGSPNTESERVAAVEAQRDETLPLPIAIGKYEITFADYDRFAQATNRALPDDGGRGRGNMPVVNVSLQDARDYADWLTLETGSSYRLPTSAEWEYAARAGTRGSYSVGNPDGSDEPFLPGWLISSEYTLNPTGSLPANPWGLHDVHGNVRELTADCAADSTSPGSNSRSPDRGDATANCLQAVARGGGYEDTLAQVRSAAVQLVNADRGARDLGFRVVRDLVRSGVRPTPPQDLRQGK